MQIQFGNSAIGVNTLINNFVHLNFLPLKWIVGSMSVCSWTFVSELVNVQIVSVCVCDDKVQS